MVKIMFYSNTCEILHMHYNILSYSQQLYNCMLLGQSTTLYIPTPDPKPHIILIYVNVLRQL